MKKINGSQVIVFGVVALLVFVLGVGLLSIGGDGRGPGWMIGPGMMGGWGFGPFGWVGMIFMMLFPVGLLVLLVLAIIWLFRQVSGPPQAATERRCPNCGRTVQADWRVCPYCEQPLIQ